MKASHLSGPSPHCSVVPRGNLWLATSRKNHTDTHGCSMTITVFAESLDITFHGHAEIVVLPPKRHARMESYDKILTNKAIFRIQAKTTRRLCCVSGKSALFRVETKLCKNTDIFHGLLVHDLAGVASRPLHLGVVSASFLLWLCISHRKLVHCVASCLNIIDSPLHSQKPLHQFYKGRSWQNNLTKRLKATGFRKMSSSSWHWIAQFPCNLYHVQNVFQVKSNKLDKHHWSAGSLSVHGKTLKHGLGRHVQTKWGWEIGSLAAGGVL